MTHYDNTTSTTTVPKDKPFEGWGSTGWICPKCGRALSPWTTTCPYCTTNPVPVRRPVITWCKR